MIFLLFPVIFLEAGLVGALEQDVTLDGVVEHELLDYTFGLEATLFPAELRQVVRGLRVVRGQHFEVNFVTLLGCEILLVVAWHVIVVLTEQVLIILKIIVVILLDLSAGGSLLCSTSSWGHVPFLKLLSLLRFKLQRLPLQRNVHP